MGMIGFYRPPKAGAEAESGYALHQAVLLSGALKAPSSKG